MDFINTDSPSAELQATDVIFGDCKLSLTTQTIIKNETVIELEPLIFSLLTYFINHRDKVISRQELVEQVWQRSFVDDNAINRAMSELRKVVRTPTHSDTIKTYYRQGYSFTLDVEFINDSKSGNILRPQFNGFKKHHLYLAASLLFIGFIWLFSQFFINTGSVESRPLEDAVQMDKAISTEALSSNQNEVKETLIGTKRGTSLLPKLSKDERFLAHSSLTNEAVSLSIIDLQSSGQSQTITEQYDLFPIGWSDKNELYYQLSNLGDPFVCQLWKMEVTEELNAAERTKIFDCDSHHVLSADIIDKGNTLLYTKFNYRGHKNLSAIVSYDLNSKEAFQVTSPNIANIGDYYVRASHSEQKVAFLRENNSNIKVFIANADGSELMQIASVNHYISSLAWGEQDESLSWFDQKDMRLYTYDLNTKLTSSRLVNTEHKPKEAFALDLVDEHRAIITTSYWDLDLFQISLTAESQQVTAISNTPLGEVHFAPFHHTEGGIYYVQGSGIWQVKDNSKQKLFTNDSIERNLSATALSPDDSKILFTTKEGLSIYQLSDANMRLETHIPLSDIATESYWLTNTKLVLSYNKNNQVNLYTYDLTTAELEKISEEVVISFEVLNSDQILYSNGRSEFKRYTFSSGLLETLNLSEQSKTSQMWAVDNGFLYYDDSNMGIYREDLEQLGNTTKVYQGQQPFVSFEVRKNLGEEKLYLSITQKRDNLMLDVEF